MGKSVRGSTGRHVVVAGGSFAGLAAAFTLRKRLEPDDRVTVVDPSGIFFFKPSLVGAALGRPALRASFEIGPVLASRGIEYVRSHVRRVDVEGRSIGSDDGDIGYDTLIIATGGGPNAQSVTGAAGEFSENHYIVGQATSEDVRNRVLQLIRDPGPIVVGVIQGAGYISAMYELALGLDSTLRRERVRDQASITFVTAEPYLGNLGFGQTAAQSRFERQFLERGIEYRTGVDVKRVARGEVVLDGGEALPATASFLMPPFTGDVDLWKSHGLTDESGRVPIDARYKHVTADGVYAAGVAARFARPVPRLQGMEPPQTGYLSIQMGKRAAQNVASLLGCGSPADQTLPWLLDVRIIEAADSGLLLGSYGGHHLTHRALPLPGALSSRLKVASERYVTRRLHAGKVSFV
jgi:sulfide:quinone oxidoreductase